MKQLNWFNPDAPDESMYIGGVQITPETWIGGVVSRRDEWRCLHAFSRTASSVTSGFDAGCSTTHRIIRIQESVMGPGCSCTSFGRPAEEVEHPLDTWYRCTRPVYPPVGFGGLGEDEIWEYFSVRGDLLVWEDDDWAVAVSMSGDTPTVCAGTYQHYPCLYDVPYVPALITALQNAQVLSQRLKDAHNE